MFKNTLNVTNSLSQGTMVSVQIAIDDDGFIDRVCPAHNCSSVFKVQYDDWKNLVRDEQVFCPVCRHESESGEWNTEEQIEYLKAQAVSHLQGVISSALKKDAQQFNRKQPRSSFINIAMNVKPAARPVLVPPDVFELMQQQFVCEECNCRYAAIGTAFFCPACGHNSSITAFKTTITTVRNTIGNLSIIKQTLTDSIGKDAAENTCRQILEDNYCRLVSAFQKYAEASFMEHPDAHLCTVKQNVFQRLDQSSTLWQQITGKSYVDMIGEANLAQLSNLFQKRHLLQHQDGIIDQKYIDKSGDLKLKKGQRLVIRSDDVYELADLIELTAAEIKKIV